MSKYGNQPTVLFGVKFDSKAEAWRYPVLKERLESGEIKDLHIQPRYTLIPAFQRDGMKRQAITYIADFDYLEVATGKRIVEDVKGGKATQTEVFRIKRKLFEYFYPTLELRIVEVG